MPQDQGPGAPTTHAAPEARSAELPPATALVPEGPGQTRWGATPRPQRFPIKASTTVPVSSEFPQAAHRGSSHAQEILTGGLGLGEGALWQVPVEHAPSRSPGPAGWERRAAASRVLTGTVPAATLWLSQALPSFIYCLSRTRQDGRTPAPQHPLHGPQPGRPPARP